MQILFKKSPISIVFTILGSDFCRFMFCGIFLDDLNVTLYVDFLFLKSLAFKEEVIPVERSGSGFWYDIYEFPAVSSKIVQ